MQLYVCGLSVLLSVVLLQTPVHAAVGARVVEPNPDHPGKCFDPVTNAAYAVDEIWSKAGECIQYRCSNGPENKFLINSVGCGVAAPGGPSCSLAPGDTSKAFPDCCPQITCH